MNFKTTCDLKIPKGDVVKSWQHTQLFLWAAQILHRDCDIPIWISTLHMNDDDDNDDVNFRDLTRFF